MARREGHLLTESVACPGRTTVSALRGSESRNRILTRFPRVPHMRTRRVGALFTYITIIPCTHIGARLPAPSLLEPPGTTISTAMPCMIYNEGRAALDIRVLNHRSRRGVWTPCETHTRLMHLALECSQSASTSSQRSLPLSIRIVWLPGLFHQGAVVADVSYTKVEATLARNSMSGFCHSNDTATCWQYLWVTQESSPLRQVLSNDAGIVCSQDWPFWIIAGDAVFVQIGGQYEPL